MFSVKANKKLILQHVREMTGTVVTLRDIHNADLKGKTVAVSDINTLVNELRKNSSAAIDESNCMKAVSYRDANMITNQRNYPEILLLNATYKLNDLRMPLCVLMCIDGNCESPVAALSLLPQRRPESQNRIHVSAEHPSKHFWMKIFFNLANMVLLNTYILSCV